jgi:hypothetical protein
MINIIAVVIAAPMDFHWDFVPCQRTESTV